MGQIGDLLGQTLVEVTRVGDEELLFVTDNGAQYRMCHHQDCCEAVEIEDIAGDLADLVGAPILQAECVTNEEGDDVRLPAKERYDESYTWTFYKLATIKGSVTIRWYGSSNGYYSESVNFDLLRQPAAEADGTI